MDGSGYQTMPMGGPEMFEGITNARYASCFSMSPSGTTATSTSSSWLPSAFYQEMEENDECGFISESAEIASSPIEIGQVPEIGHVPFPATFQPYDPSPLSVATHPRHLKPAFVGRQSPSCSLSPVA